MKSRVLQLRVWETVFLLLAVEGGSVALNVISFAFSINLRAGPAVASSVWIGFAFSLAATLAQRHTIHPALGWISLVLSSLGLLSYVNEFIRSFAGYGFQILIDVGLFLVVLDWIAFGTDKTLAGRRRRTARATLNGR